jgi:hypothetical protein
VEDSEPSTQELKLRQLEQEVAQREAAAEAETGAEAESGRRRADKAHYLRQKLEQREESERQATQEDD